MMEKLTPEIMDRLIENGRKRARWMAAGKPPPDFYPVVKLFTPDAGCTWLLTDIDPEDPDTAFGLCDVCDGSPKLTSVRFSELETIRGDLGLPVGRDFNFVPTKPVSAYAEDARQLGHVWTG